MEDKTQNIDIDLVLEIRPWTFDYSRRSDIHFYYHAVENVPMMFDGFEILPIKIGGKRLGMVNYSDSQRKDFKQLTGVAMDELMLKMQLLKYFRGTNVYPFEVENEGTLTNILRDIFAENLAKENKNAQIERLITTWFDQEKEWFELETKVNSVNSLNFIWFVTYESKIKLDELIDLEEFMESKERVIELMGVFYAQEKDKRLKAINPPLKGLSNETKIGKLELREIALWYYYDRDNLTLLELNANEVAKSFDWVSGKTLMKHFRKVRDFQTERRNHKNSRQYLEKVIPLLTTNRGKNEAQEDLKNVKP